MFSPKEYNDCSKQNKNVTLIKGRNANEMLSIKITTEILRLTLSCFFFTNQTVSMKSNNLKNVHDKSSKSQKKQTIYVAKCDNK